MVAWSSVAASWGLFGTIVILGWWYYTQDGKRRRGGRTADLLSLEKSDRKQILAKPKRRKDKERDLEPSEPVSSDVPEAGTLEVHTGASGQEQLQSRKKTKKQKWEPLAQSSAVEVSSATAKAIAADESDDLDAKEFARQMSKAKAGTTLSTPQKASQRVKTRKQGKVNGVFDDSSSTGKVASGTSSNTGADADDDLSPVVSPALQAAGAPLDESGVSDMLEKPAPGPSSLRITESTQPQRVKVQQKKTAEPEETKRQRKRRAQREAEKEAQRESEAQRQILQEKQRRGARIAEGRPAKDGGGWTYASGLPANAWTSKTPASDSTARTPNDAPLLDTFEDQGEVDTSNGQAASQAGLDPASKQEDDSISSGQSRSNLQDAPKNQELKAGAEKLMGMLQPQSVATQQPERPSNGNGVSGVSSSASSTQWENGLPSEEEQLRMFKEQSESSEWTTVPATKRAKRRSAAEEKGQVAEAKNEVSDFDVMI